MNPQTLKRLQENLPELKELRMYLASEVKKADTLHGIEELPVDERSHEVSVRAGVKRRLETILTGLFPVDTATGADPKEYAIEV